MKLIKKIVFTDGEELDIQELKHIIICDYPLNHDELIIDYKLNKKEDIKIFSNKCYRLAVAFRYMGKYGIAFPEAMAMADDEFIGEFKGKNDIN